MPSFNSVVTTNNYQEFRWVRSKRVTFAIFNAPILARFAVVSRSNSNLYDSAYDFESAERNMINAVAWAWTPEDFAFADYIVGALIKSAVVNTPATVTIHA